MKKILALLLILSSTIRAHDESNEIHETFIQHDMTADQEPLRAEQLTTITWTKPTIIDDNNPVSILKFQENIIFKPTANYVYPNAYSTYPAAIIIATNNVTIDLNGFNLSLDQSSTSNFSTNKQVYGISILPGLKNIKIISSTPQDTKGSINNFSGFAIYAKGSSQASVYDVYANMIKNITISNLLISYNFSGIFIANALEVSITNTDSLYNFSSRVNYGIYLSNVLDGAITNCRTNRNYSYLDTYGIYAQDTIGLNIDSCQASSNRSLKQGNAIGINISGTSSTTSYNNRIMGSQANANLCAFVTGKKSVGFYISGGSYSNIIQENGTISNSHGPLFGNATTPTTYPIGYGFLLENTNTNQIHQNKSGFQDGYGFFDTSNISTSIFTCNAAMMNSTANYSVTVPTSSGSQTLPTIVLYPNNLTAYTGISPLFANIEVTAP